MNEYFMVFSATNFFWYIHTDFGQPRRAASDHEMMDVACMTWPAFLQQCGTWPNVIWCSGVPAVDLAGFWDACNRLAKVHAHLNLYIISHYLQIGSQKRYQPPTRSHSRGCEIWLEVDIFSGPLSLLTFSEQICYELAADFICGRVSVSVMMCETCPLTCVCDMCRIQWW